MTTEDQVQHYMFAEELVKDFPLERLNDEELLTDFPQWGIRLQLAQVHATLGAAGGTVAWAADQARKNRQAKQDAARADVLEMLNARA